MLHDLYNVVEEIDRAYNAVQANLGRRDAVRQQLAVLTDQEEQAGALNVTQMLDAQQRLAAVETEFFRSLVEYSLAIKNLHTEKGSLMSYHQVFLSEEM